MLGIKNKPISAYINTFMMSLWAISLALSVKSPSLQDPYSLSIVFVHLILMIISWIILIKVPEERSIWNVSKLNLGLLMLLTLIVYYVFHQFSGQHQLWLDEYTHSIISIKNPISGSSDQQQPPLGYVWFYITNSLLGLSVRSLRYAAALPFCLGFIFFGLAGLRRGRSWPFLLIFCSLILCNSLMLFSFLDARSTTIGILNLSILVLAWVECSDSSLPFGWAKKLLLFSSSCLFLEAIGFQAPVILLAITIIHFFSWKIFGIQRFLSISKIFFLSLLFFLPEQLYLVKIAAQSGFLSVFPYIDKVHFFKDFSDHLFHTYIINHSYHVFIFVVLGLVLYLFQNYQNLQKRNAIFLFLSFLILTPLLQEILFSAFIRWQFNYRYRVCFIILTLWLSSMVLSEIKTRLKPVAIVLLSFCIFIFSQELRDKYYGYSISYRPNWEEVYTYINKEFSNKDYRAYAIGECTLENLFHCNNLPVGLEFYIPPDHLDRFGSAFQRASINSFFNDNGITYDSLHSMNKVLILIIERSDPITVEIPQSNDFSVQQTEDFVIVSSRLPLETRTGLGEILKFSTTFIKLSPRSLYLYELLLRHYLVTGRKDLTMNILNQIENSEELKKLFWTSYMNQARLQKIKLSINKYLEDQTFE